MPRLTWEQFKTVVHDMVKHDSATIVDLSNRGLGSQFDSRVLRALRTYCRETREFFVFNAGLTLTTGDQTIDLYDSAKCAREIYYPTRVFLNAVEVVESPSRADLAKYRQQVSLTNGAPTYWVRLTEDKIHFDRPIDATVAAYTTNYVEGWAEHPSISTDETVISLPISQTETAARFCAVALSLPVPTAEGVLRRLAQYDKESRDALAKRKARNIGEFTHRAVGGRL